MLPYCFKCDHFDLAFYIVYQSCFGSCDLWGQNAMIIWLPKFCHKLPRVKKHTTSLCWDEVGLDFLIKSSWNPGSSTIPYKTSVFRWPDFLGFRKKSTRPVVFGKPSRSLSTSWRKIAPRVKEASWMRHGKDMEGLDPVSFLEDFVTSC